MTYLRVGYLIKNRTELGYLTKYDEVVGGEGLTNERLTSGEKVFFSLAICSNKSQHSNIRHYISRTILHNKETKA